MYSENSMNQHRQTYYRKNDESINESMYNKNKNFSNNILPPKYVFYIFNINSVVLHITCINLIIKMIENMIIMMNCQMIF